MLDFKFIALSGLNALGLVGAIVVLAAGLGFGFGLGWQVALHLAGAS